MLRVERSANGEVVFVVSGRIETEQIADLESLVKSEISGRTLVLDLKDVIVVNTSVIAFLSRCQHDGIMLRNCPGFILEWMAREHMSEE